MLDKLDDFNKMSLREKQALMEKLTVGPALTLIVWTRKGVGARVLNPLWLSLTVIAMFGIAAFCDPKNKPVGLVVYGIHALLCGIIQRFQRWREFQRGVKQNSFYIGDSGFDFKWLPAFVRRNRLMARFFDPLFFFLAGVFLLPYVPSLGGWWMFAAVCLLTMESVVYRNAIVRDMNMVDSLVVAEIQSETVQRFTEPLKGAQSSNATTEEVSTGMSPELQELMARRKKRSSSQP